MIKHSCGPTILAGILSRSSRLILLFSLCISTIAGRAQIPPANPPRQAPPMALKVRDDFSADTHRDYQRHDDVTWLEKRLRLGPQGFLIRSVPGGPGGELRLNCAFGTAERETPSSTTVGFALSGGAAVCVTLDRRRVGEKIVNILSIEHIPESVAKQTSKPIVTRKFALSDGSLDGVWRWRYTHGVLIVEFGGREVGCGTIGTNSAALTHITVSQSGAELICRSLEIDALPVVAKITPETAERLQAVTAESSRLVEEAKYGDALAANRELLEEIRRLYGESSPLIPIQLNFRTDIEALRGNVEAWEKSAQETLAACHRTFGENHPMTASAYDSLARMAAMQNRYLEAAEHYRHALAICRKLQGDEHPQTAEAMTNLASALRQDAKFDSAQVLLDEALAVRKRVSGPEHESVAKVLREYASLARARHDDRHARELYEAALAICRKRFGNEHARTAEALIDLGYVLRSLHEYAAARQCYDEVLPIRKKLYGGVDRRTVNTQQELGGLLSEMGDYPAALEQYRQVLDIRRRIHDEDHHDIGISQYYISTILVLHLQRFGEGRDAAERAYAILSQTLGKSHAMTIHTQTLIGQSLVGERKFPEAKLRLEEALAAKRAAVGEKHFDTSLQIYLLGSLAEEMRDYPAARERFHELLTLRRAQWGEMHLDVAGALSDLGDIARRELDYAGARDYYQQAMKIRLKIGGEKHVDTASSHLDLAVLGRLAGDYEAALEQFEAALRIRRSVYGEQHPYVADVQMDLINLQTDLGKYTAARRGLEAVLAVRLKTVGPEHSDTLTALSNLAYLHQLEGNLSEAQRIGEEVLAVRLRVLGPKHPDTSYSLTSLGYVRGLQGNYAAARTLLEQALEIRRSVYGEESSETAISYTNLAELFVNQGDVATAGPYLETALKICLAVFGEQHPRTAALYASKALLRHQQGDVAGAKEMAGRAYAVRSRVLGRDHPETAVSLTQLAMLCSNQGEFQTATEHFREAIRIMETNFGPDHPGNVYRLHLTAMVQLQQNDVPAAVKSLEASLAASLRINGPEHPATNLARENLCIRYMLDGKSQPARSLLREIVKSRVKFTRDVLASLSESEALAFVESFLANQQYLAAYRTLPDITAAEAYAPVWSTKGLLSLMLAERRRSIQNDPAAALLWSELREIRAQLAKRIFAPTTPAAAPQRAAALSELNRLKEAKERELANVQADFGAIRRIADVGFSDLATRLPFDTAVVDFVKTFEFSPAAAAPSETGRYEAFVLRRADAPPGYRIDWLHLGDSETIDQAVMTWRKNIVQGLRPTIGDAELPEVLLRRRLWGPLEQSLQHCKTVIIIPDGPLTRLPWAALPGRLENGYLLEDYVLTTAAHGQHLFSVLNAPPVVGDDCLLVGGVNYDLGQRPASEVIAANESVASRSPAMRGTKRPAWQYLPGTAEEVETVAGLWTSRGALHRREGSAAVESDLKSLLPKSRYVLLATHGFFADEIFRSAFQIESPGDRLALGGFELTGRRASATARNPLLLSGVVLAGANRKDDVVSGSSFLDDGILTAEEIADADLRNTELVVLSACETGLGEVAGGEGVFGLQRSFALAGARSTVASLWQVSDSATKALMTRFFENLWRKKLPKAVALREAQIWLLREGIKHHEIWRGADVITTERSESGARKGLPLRYWAAFTLSGDWR